MTKKELNNIFDYAISKQWIIIKDYGSVVSVISTDTTERAYFFFDKEEIAKKVIKVGSPLEKVSH